MLRDRLALYRDRARRNLTQAFEEARTPHQVASSFAVGVFFTTLPTGGLAIGLFFVFAYLFSWVSKPAMFASVAVLNPFVKPPLYVVGFQFGSVLTGAEVGVPDESTLTAMFTVGLGQFLVGMVALAVVFSTIGYVVVLRLTRAHRRRRTEGRSDSIWSVAVAFLQRRKP